MTWKYLLNKVFGGVLLSLQECAPAFNLVDEEMKVIVIYSLSSSSPVPPWKCWGQVKYPTHTMPRDTYHCLAIWIPFRPEECFWSDSFHLPVGEKEVEGPGILSGHYPESMKVRICGLRKTIIILLCSNHSYSCCWTNRSKFGKVQNMYSIGGASVSNSQGTNHHDCTSSHGPHELKMSDKFHFLPCSLSLFLPSYAWFPKHFCCMQPLFLSLGVRQSTEEITDLLLYKQLESIASKLASNRYGRDWCIAQFHMTLDLILFCLLHCCSHTVHYCNVWKNHT